VIVKNIMSKSRPTFYLNDDETKPVRAGGVIIYKFTRKGMNLLLIENNGKYEDIGGCSDEEDKTYIDTIVREVYEETNKLIKRKNTRQKLASSPSVYISISKYVIYFIEATERQKKLTQKDFGSKEKHDNIERTIQWIPLSHFLDSNIIQHKLNFRLKNKVVFDKLKHLDNMHKIREKTLSETST
jgi:8-oxo-dGTP pyrophosphatase MutT (NUDIX family)